MRKRLKRLGALALAGMMLALSACGDNSPSAPGGDAPGGQAAMGRYIEEEYTLPEGVGYVAAVHRAEDGSIRLLCNLDKEMMLGKWYVYASTDGGRRWMQEETPWLDGLGELLTVEAAAWDRAGNLYMQYMPMTQAEFDALMAQMEAAKGGGASAAAAESAETSASSDAPAPEGDAAGTDGEDAGDNGDEGLTSGPQMPSSKLVKVDPAGNVEELGFTLEAQMDYGTLGARGLQVAENGDLIAECACVLAQFDPATGECKHLYDPEAFANSISYTTLQDTLAMTDGDLVTFYDLTTGEQTGSFSTAGQQPEDGGPKVATIAESASYERVLASDPENGAVYFADSTGVYRHLLDGAVTERLIDGELCSLNMPALRLTDLIVKEDGSLLLLYADGMDRTLMNYTYSADTPTVPDKELRVFSLRDNKTIRQAMGLFQRQNPDVHVVYDVALTGADAVTASDALRTLANELLAGKGPDLLVLDGMPIDSYVEKGVLLDLSEPVGGKTASGEWLKAEAESFKTADGRIYAVPARFSVPVILADEEAARAKDLTALADWLAAQAGRFPGIHGGALSIVHPAAMIDLFYPVCSPAWFQADGSMDEEAFRAFLTDLKRICDSATSEQAEESKAAYEYTGGASYDLLWDGLRWTYDMLGAAAGSLDSVKALAAPDACIVKHGGGELAPLPGQVSGVFVPRTILGVNAESKQADMAQAFLGLVLSEQVQKNNFDDGMPVNAAAFSNGFVNPNPGDPDGMYYGSSWTGEDGEEISMDLQVTWPSDAFMENAENWITALDTPSASDEVVKQMVLDETAGYFDGTRTLDEAVTALREKLNIYLAE